MFKSNDSVSVTSILDSDIIVLQTEIIHAIGGVSVPVPYTKAFIDSSHLLYE